MSDRRGRCSSCGAPIVWATSSTSGKSIPLDPDPVDDGNIIYDGQYATALKGGERSLFDTAETFHKTHFATCPNAGEHRRKQ